MQEENAKPTLDQVLHVMNVSEEYLEEFDPEVVVGNVEDKIDSIYYILEKMKVTTDHLKAMAKPITSKASAINNSRERLREYVLFQMMKHEYNRLPGKAFKAEIREGHHRVIVTAEKSPSPKDAQAYQEFVKTEVSFSWDQEAIEKAFVEGRELPPGVSAQNGVTRWVAFSAHVPVELEPKKKARSKK